MTLIGPKRTFGKGESREQNAIIKVYSAAELKVALTKVYGLPNGVGTIQIAGDITITEPIKLRQFVVSESAPREIIIQSVGGARIYNGNTTSGSYNYNQAGNTEIPVFDFGVCDDQQKVSKYTFKDLIINNDTSRPFGAFVAGDLDGNTDFDATSFMTLVTITNLKLTNVRNVFAAYDTSATFGGFILGYAPRIEGLVFKITETVFTDLKLNSANFASFSGLFNNITTWNIIESLTYRFTINTNRGLISNSISAVSPIINLVEYPGVTTLPSSTPQNGSGNVITGCTIGTDFTDTSFTFINCDFFNNLGRGSTLIPTVNTNNSFIVYNNAKQLDVSSGVLDEDFVVKASYSVYTNGVPNLPGTFDERIYITNLQQNSNYEVNWRLSVRERSTDKCNTYHIKTNLKRTTAANGIIVSSSTISASEEFFTLTGLIPVASINGCYIAPTLGAGNLLDVACTIEIIGYKIPSNLI